MARITEDYCSYEVAKLLEEKGFPIVEHLFMYVNKDGRLMTDHQACLTMTNEEYRTFFDNYIPTVTQALAMKWLRGNNIIIIPQPEYFSCDKCESWGIDIWAGGNYEKSLLGFPNYEEAVEAALKYCLTELL